MSQVIRVENLAKQYRLGQVSTGTIGHDINRWWHRVRGKEDPYLTVGDTNDRTQAATSDYVWALRNVNFSVNQGEVLGIIGRNGAGKSTLLKILSRTTAPTTGSLKIKGRVASLLEVGTGFHPELSGRDNVFLNGTILGMTKNEIKRKFDEIVDFAGVARYIDTPVKRYSSGMYVRLAFAVAAHLESEILIVDEVLAVGDSEFQKKCLGKMGAISKGEGRTVLFVSHNMAAVSALCTQGLVLQQGTTLFDGGIKKAMDMYIASGSNSTSHYISEEDTPNDIKEISILNQQQEVSNNFYFNEAITVRMKFVVENVNLEEAEVGIRVTDQRERIVFTSQKPVEIFKINNNGFYEIECFIPKNLLVPNTYKILGAIHIPNKKILSLKDNVVSFSIEETGTDFHMYSGVDYGCVFVPCEWKNTEK